MNYKEYYENQCGSGLPVFHGAKYQRGYGLGNVFRSFFRWIAPVFKTHALPLLKEGAQTIGTEAVRTIANVANDTLEGDKFSQSLRNRSKEAINSLASKIESKLQTGEGYKKKLKKKKKHFAKRKPKRKVKRKASHSLRRRPKRRRTKQDIFDLL
jgi:hypothetical protein